MGKKHSSKFGKAKMIGCIAAGAALAGGAAGFAYAKKSGKLDKSLDRLYERIDAIEKKQGIGKYDPAIRCSMLKDLGVYEQVHRDSTSSASDRGGSMATNDADASDGCGTSTDDDADDDGSHIIPNIEITTPCIRFMDECIAYRLSVLEPNDIKFWFGLSRDSHHNIILAVNVRTDKAVIGVIEGDTILIGDNARVLTRNVTHRGTPFTVIKFLSEDKRYWWKIIGDDDNARFVRISQAGDDWLELGDSYELVSIEYPFVEVGVQARNADASDNAPISTSSDGSPAKSERDSKEKEEAATGKADNIVSDRSDKGDIKKKKKTGGKKKKAKKDKKKK